MFVVMGIVDVSVFFRVVVQVVVVVGCDELLLVFMGVCVEINGEIFLLLVIDCYWMVFKEIIWNFSVIDVEVIVLVLVKVINEIVCLMIFGEYVIMNFFLGDSGEGFVGFEGDGVNGVCCMIICLLSGEFFKVCYFMDIKVICLVWVCIDEFINLVCCVFFVVECNILLWMVINDDLVVLLVVMGDQV